MSGSKAHTNENIFADIGMADQYTTRYEYGIRREHDDSWYRLVWRKMELNDLHAIAVGLKNARD